MKKLSMFAAVLFLSVSASCVDEPSTSESSDEISTPDAGTEPAGRKGGETMPCNCD